MTIEKNSSWTNFKPNRLYVKLLNKHESVEKKSFHFCNGNLENLVSSFGIKNESTKGIISRVLLRIFC